jgi:hypothetical protein
VGFDKISMALHLRGCHFGLFGVVVQVGKLQMGRSRYSSTASLS